MLWKVTLLAEWFADPARDWTCAWLSLEASEGDPSSYWPYLLTSIDRALPGVGGAFVERLDQVPIEAALASLINELAALERDVIIILDDYHTVDGPELRTGMTFLVEHLPSNVHLVLATRADPNLPIARLRRATSSWRSQPLTCGSPRKKQRRISATPSSPSGISLGEPRQNVPRACRDRLRHVAWR